MNDYWEGNVRARLERADVTADWGSGTNSGSRIGFANRVFQFWYDARQNIDACGDSTQQAQMTKELEKCGYTGAGLGIDDLNEAFNYYESQGGVWSDNTESWNYYGGPKKLFHDKMLISDVPVPFVSFANAVDERLELVRDAIKNFDQQTQTIDIQIEGSTTTDWDRVGSALSEVATWGERIKPFLWARPRLEDVVGKTASFASALGNIHGGLTTYVSATRHFSQREALLIGGLKTAVSFIPVLGSYYGGMVDLIPTLAEWMTNLVEDRIRRIDRASYAH
ncbi:MAG: hypothetical protein ACI9G1_004211 [Pirellulaceae bacterium]|jgi:hypothetical protein